MKQLPLFFAIICVLLICNGCGFDAEMDIDEAPQLSPEAELMWDHFELKEIVQHESLDVLLENCATESIKAIMKEFPADKFDRVYYFNAYYLWDDDHNFPTSVVAFDEGGVTYYFAGAEQHNPFAPEDYSDSRLYAAKDTASVHTVKRDGWTYACSLAYFNSEGEYALSPISQVDAEAYFEVLAEIVGAEFRCVNNNVVSIDEDTVFVSYQSRKDFDELTYSLSNPEVLRESSYSFEKGEYEIVNYSSDPEAPGADMIRHPDYLRITFDAVGTGRTVLELTGDGNEAVYSVEIAVDKEFGAFLPDPFT